MSCELAPSSQNKRGVFERCLREPLLHFTLLGALIFAVNAWRADGVRRRSPGDAIDITREPWRGCARAFRGSGIGRRSRRIARAGE
jgi:hypothetical protein